MDSTSSRTIMDLSFPKNLLVNDGVIKDIYLGTDFQMHYPSVDSIQKTLNTIGPEAQILRWILVESYRSRD